MLLINKTLIKLSKGFRRWIVAIAVLKMVILVGISMFASSIGNVLGQIYSLNMNMAELKESLFRAFLAAVLMLAGELLVGEAEHRCTAQARIRIRREIFQKVLELDVGDVDKLGETSTINAAVDGVELMQVYYNRYLPGLIYSVAAPIYLFFVLKEKCFPAALMLLIVSLVITPLNNFSRQIIDKLKSDYWFSLEELTSYYLESINGLTTTELFNRGEEREKTLCQKARHLSDIIIRVMKINFSSIGLNEIFMNVAIFASVLIVCSQLMQGKIELPQALTVLMLSFSFFGSLRQLQWIAHNALMGVAAAQNVERIQQINTERETKEVLNVENTGLEGIQFQQVSFAYKTETQVLRDINLTIPKNKTTAIAGESGCGKSTIVNMLLRFYDTQTGKITLNGRDYKTIEPEQLRKNIIMVPQSVYIFSGTIRDNLLMADENATEEMLMEVLEKVKLKEWTESLECGLDTYVGDAGSRLSGGQRQKVGIARALLSKAEYIIFDEATSNVDEASEQEIWSCIRELGRTCTLIIISHRLSTIRHADCVYLIEDGCVKESGTHDELMKQNGTYSELVRQQEELEAGGTKRRAL